MTKARQGSTVKVHYTGTLDDGTVFDSSLGGEPLVVTIGSSQVISGFERGLMGMAESEKKTIRLEPNEAYGFRNEDLLFIVPRSDVPVEIKCEVGQRYQISDGEGNTFVAAIVNLAPEEVTFDANHPLAGMALNFDLEMIEIRP